MADGALIRCQDEEGGWPVGSVVLLCRGDRPPFVMAMTKKVGMLAGSLSLVEGRNTFTLTRNDAKPCQFFFHSSVLF